MTLAEQVRRRRTALGLSQRQLAEQIGSEQTVISALELGKTVPGTYTVYRICKALHISADELLGLKSVNSQWNEFALGYRAGYQEAAARMVKALKIDPRIGVPPAGRNGTRAHQD